MTTNTASRARQAGFTLIDLTLALAVAGVLLSTTFTSLQQTLPLWRVRQAANDVAVGLRATRLQALVSQDEVALPIDAARRRYSIVSRISRPEAVPVEAVPYGSPTPVPVPTPPVPRRIVTLPQGVGFVAPPGVSSSSELGVAFDARGRLIATTLPYVIPLGNASQGVYMRLLIARSGNVTAQRWDGSAWR